MKKKIIILKKAKNFSQRENFGCGLAALVVKIPIKVC